MVRITLLPSIENKAIQAAGPGFGREGDSLGNGCLCSDVSGHKLEAVLELQIGLDVTRQLLERFLGTGNSNDIGAEVLNGKEGNAATNAARCAGDDESGVGHALWELEVNGTGRRKRCWG